jgi:sugar O-acyltransferase (sialic acid O-acetyltransferase NeuD family)
MNRRIIVIGAGSHGQGIREIIEANRFQFLGYLDDCLEKKDVLGTMHPETVFKLKGFYHDAEFVIGLNSPTERSRIEHMFGMDYKWAKPLIHPSAVVGSNCGLANGVVVQAGVVLTTNVTLSRHVHVNVGATVSQGSALAAYTSVGPGAHIAGEVNIGEGSFVGAGAIISNLVNVTGGTTIGAGAVVIRDVGMGGTYVGVPAKRLEK